MNMSDESLKDAFDMLCGEKIGTGSTRQVFKCKIRPDLIVKVEDADYRYFANVMEMKFWNDHEHYEKVAKWLAPCEFLSPNGRILLQKRVDPIPYNFQLPEQIPSFLTDIKRENFGIYNGNLVCIDYAMTIPNPSIRLRKAEW